MADQHYDKDGNPVGVSYDAQGNPVVSSQTAKSDQPDDHSGLLDAIGRGISNYWEQVNPVTAVKAAGKIVTDLPGAVSGVLAAQQVPFEKAKESFKSGDYITGARHALDYLIPVLGPMLDEQSDKAQRGDVAGSIGGTLGIATNLLGPELAAKALPSSIGVRGIRNTNPVEQAAIAFGEREGVPIDAATATGSRVVRGVQKAVDSSLGGGMVAERARTAQAEALAAAGDRLAARSTPAAVTTEQAGQAATGALKSEISRLHGDASTAYDSLRNLERVSPDTFTVDLRQSKAALKPIYDQLMREKEVTGQLMGPKARAATALDGLMNAPDAAPLSVVDSALGDIKAMARGADMPELRNASQATAAEAVKSLDAAVRKAAQTAGPQAEKALETGRAATKSKYAVADVLDALTSGSAEGVRPYDRLTAPRDSRVALLRQVQQLAPNEVPKVARAYLDTLLDKATAEGGFGRAKGIAADWGRLGPETKKALFRDPAYVQDLDNFFTLAKKIEENPNPSGTGQQVILAAQGGLIWHDPIRGVASQIPLTALSKLLHSKVGVKLLTQGLRLPIKATGAAKALRIQLLKNGLDLPVASPAAAEADQSAP